MKNDKLNGLWNGVLKYGNSYPEKYQSRLEPFSLDILFDGDNFKGICKDNFTEEIFKTPATVEGTFVPNLISFIKRYPGLLVVNENEETIVVPEKPSIDIHYTGMFYKGLFSRTLRFEGEWVMTSFYFNELGKKGR
jgi:hypothetical protein